MTQLAITPMVLLVLGACTSELPLPRLGKPTEGTTSTSSPSSDPDDESKALNVEREKVDEPASVAGAFLVCMLNPSMNTDPTLQAASCRLEKDSIAMVIDPAATTTVKVMSSDATPVEIATNFTRYTADENWHWIIKAPAGAAFVKAKVTLELTIPGQPSFFFETNIEDLGILEEIALKGTYSVLSQSRVGIDQTFATESYFRIPAVGYKSGPNSSATTVRLSLYKASAPSTNVGTCDYSGSKDVLKLRSCSNGLRADSVFQVIRVRIKDLTVEDSSEYFNYSFTLQTVKAQ